jgi:hypothetical protein
MQRVSLQIFGDSVAFRIAAEQLYICSPEIKQEDLKLQSSEITLLYFSGSPVIVSIQKTCTKITASI